MVLCNLPECLSGGLEVFRGEKLCNACNSCVRLLVFAPHINPGAHTSGGGGVPFIALGWAVPTSFQNGMGSVMPNAGMAIGTSSSGGSEKSTSGTRGCKTWWCRLEGYLVWCLLMLILYSQCRLESHFTCPSKCQGFHRFTRKNIKCCNSFNIH